MINNFFDKLQHIVKTQPNKVALIQDSKKITYDMLMQEILSRAGYLDTIKSSKSIGLFFPNSLELIYWFFATLLTQRIAVPLHKSLSAEEIEEIAQTVSLDMIICSESLALPKINTQATIQQQDCHLTINNKWQDDLPDIQKLAAIYFTSGSTGKPKGIMHSIASLTEMAKSCADGMGYQANDRLLVTMPITFASASVHVIMGLYHKSTLIIEYDFCVEHFKKCLLDQQPTVLCMIGEPYFKIIHSDQFLSNDFQSIRIALTGGDTITKTMIKQFKQKTGRYLIKGYGMSEALLIAQNISTEEKKLGTIGKFNQHIKSKIVDDKRQTVKQGELGELWIKGDNIMLGYFNNEELNNEVLVDGWFCTGDTVSVDDDGDVSFWGRTTQMINRNGQKIPPILIEEQLAQHPQIRKCAVIAIEDAKEGQVPVAFVEASNAEISVSEINKHLMERLAESMMPAKVIIIDKLPLTRSEKIDRQKLTFLLNENYR